MTHTYTVPSGKLQGRIFALCGDALLALMAIGVVKSKFRSNLPPHAFGASVRVYRGEIDCADPRWSTPLGIEVRSQLIRETRAK